MAGLGVYPEELASRRLASTIGSCNPDRGRSGASCGRYELRRQLEEPMRQIALLTGTAVVACLAGLLVAFLVGPPPADQIARGVDYSAAVWDAYGYRSAAAIPARRYNVRLAMKETGESPQVRVLLNQQNQWDYYFVEFTGDRTAIGIVQDGREYILDSSGKGVFRPHAVSEILLKRRDVSLEVYANDVRVARAWGERFQRGEVAVGQIGGAVSLESFRLQPVSDIFFSDDFMKAATEEGAWDVVGGDWHVEALKNPALSSNAFFYVGKRSEAPALATSGHWFWDNYTFRVACRPLGTGPVGIVAYYRSPDDYYLFRWQAGSVDTRDSHRQLIRKRNGEETVLAESKGGYSAGQWYELGLTVKREEVRAWIDGNPVLEAADATLCSGGIGLYTEDSNPVYFDDAYVFSEQEFVDDFGAPDAGRWQALGGTWRAGGDGAGTMEASVVAKGKAVAGSGRWHDYLLSADVRQWRKGTVGLCAHYQDEGHCYLLRLLPAERKLELRMVTPEGQPVLDERALDRSQSFPCNLALDLRGGLIRGMINGETVVAAPSDARLPRGKIGLIGEGCEANFDNVKVVFRGPDEPVLTLNEVFAGEKSMSEWSASESDWGVRREERPSGSAVHIYWHRADFPGDCDLEAVLTGKVGASKSAGTLGLTVAGDGESTETGYRLLLESEKKTAALYRSGSPVGEAASAVEVRESLKLRKRGDFVLAYADGKRILCFRDLSPLRGAHVAFSTTAKELDTSCLAVYSPNIYAYNFQKAPDEWREAGGVWKVTNRWQCDPRWSFFSGQSKEVAAIWNKRQFEGDLTLEFSAGIKMDAARGARYEYASDINATIGADGKNLTSGYSFLFGGKENSGTQILRGNEVVAESPFRIPSGIHRHWFYIKIRKQGRRLSLWIDKRPVLEFTDPNPLDGPYVALWTHHNGIMVTRVRISSESGRTRESPDPTRPPVAGCFYDE